MEKLVIKWQRLVEENKTCPRCGDTEKELERAFLKLKDAFALLNIEVILEKIQLSKEDFKRNPLSSNQIWINNKPLEFWINAVLAIHDVAMFVAMKTADNRVIWKIL
jgi:hypothetical protein